ncbi:hypothetical protein CRUP_000560 [Coryphaenoides rupestris]|nr:hypothetical protein CRUP_000560 [Coryphaenoides rupestris]
MPRSTTELESDKRKAVSKTLRFIAHYYAASLLGFFNHLAFGLERGKSVSFDASKPLVIPSGSDSFTQIGSPPTTDVDITSLHAKNPLDLWKKVYETVFPPEELDAVQEKCSKSWKELELGT